ncbi:hypothetical protein C0992_009992 [Termitomyces sp. T32_za158]|nr:hypothetical protein C0992_009992 [Termitomyces sp. T32_za158]
MAPSYQLPDLLSLCQSLELRANAFCRPAAVSSESWLLSLKTAESSDLLTPTERDCLHSAKFGLLAALCVPGCGQPQLTFLANFISILSIADGRLKAAAAQESSGWSSDIEDIDDGVMILEKHEMFRYLLPELKRLVARATTPWTTRFTHADVVAYNHDQLQGNHHNLITVLMTHKHLSLQGAVNLAGSMIKDMFDSFVGAEKSLFDHPRSSQINTSRTNIFSFPWSWFTLSRSTIPSELPIPNLEEGDELAHLGDLSSYVQILKDFIVGTINWAYETELYFGKKGEEIRTFGWVFLNSAADSQE